MNGQKLSRQWKYFSCVAFALAVSATAPAPAQQPPEPPPASTPPASSSKTGKKYSHVSDFLIRGTVFNEKALSFPGVELRIRVAGEKKYRWETYTNSRGEFAVRVPQGTNYEMLVHVNGFADQTRTINTKNGENEEGLVFRMVPIEGGKK